MNCREFDQLWQRRFEGTATGVSSAEAQHLATCERCQMHYEAGLYLDDAIVAWRGRRPLSPSQSSRLTDRIVRAIEAEQRPPASDWRNSPRFPAGQSALRSTPSRSPRAIALAGLVATLAGVWTLTGFLTRPAGVPESSGTMAASVPTQRTGDPGTPPSLAPSTPEQELALRTRQAYEPMARRAAGALDDVATLVVPRWSRFGQPAAATPPRGNPSGGESEPQLLRELEREIRPIGKGIGEALDFLWIAGQTPRPQPGQ